MSDRFAVKMLNTTQGPGNIAVVDFTCAAGGGSGTINAERCAGILAYLGALGTAGVFGASTSIFGIDLTLSGGAGALPQPFPVAMYAGLQALNVGIIPAWTAYNTTTGSGSLEAVGTSVTVSLYSATPGRKTTGRHYLPYPGTAVNDGNGRLVSTAPGQIEAAYYTFILGIDTAPYAGTSTDLLPVVTSATVGDTAITTPKVSRNFARLKTRTR